MRELQLHVKPGNWRKFMARRLSPAFKRIAEKIHQRDKHTCRYCGFQAEAFLDVVNDDQDYSNNKASNLVTACCFCSQCCFLEAIGKDDMSGGQLLYLPEISQAHLNSFCHVLFCAMEGDSTYQADAQVIYRNLKQRGKMVEDAFGDGMSNPRTLGELIIEHEATKKEKIAGRILDNLRLIPTHAKFETQLKAWAESAKVAL